MYVYSKSKTKLHDQTVSCTLFHSNHLFFRNSMQPFENSYWFCFSGEVVVDFDISGDIKIPNIKRQLTQK